MINNTRIFNGNTFTNNTTDVQQLTLSRTRPLPPARPARRTSTVGLNPQLHLRPPAGQFREVDMGQSAAGNIENNSNAIIGSTLSNSAVTAGSHARASVSVGGEEHRELAMAIAELRQALQEAQSEVDRRDDETRERLELAESRLKALEEEFRIAQTRDPSRIKKLMTGIRDVLTGLTSLTVSADSLWEAVEKAIR